MSNTTLNKHSFHGQKMGPALASAGGQAQITKKGRVTLAVWSACFRLTAIEQAGVATTGKPTTTTSSRQG